MSPDPVTPEPEYYPGLHLLRAPQVGLFSATRVLIAANVGVYVFMAAFLGSGWFETKDMTPYILYGANNAAATGDGQWWRLLTSMFMHYGILHLVLNMWALYQAGEVLERLQGRALYVLTYLASGLAGGLVSGIWHGDKIWSAGASGAIFGVYGALLGYMLREHHAFPKAVFAPMMRSTLTFAAYNLVFGQVRSGIDNGAHVGGLVSGVILGWLTAPPSEASQRALLYPRRLAAGLAAAGAMIAAGVLAFPRYDYSVADETALADAIHDPATRETALMASLSPALADWEAGRAKPGVLESLIETQALPIYTEMQGRLRALHLKPGRRSEQNREVLLACLSLRLEAYQHLLAAVRSSDPAELAAFKRLEAESGAKLASLKLVRR